MSFIDPNDKLEVIDALDDGNKIYLFKPSFFRLVPISGNTISINFRKWIRFVQMLKKGYRVYIFTSSNDIVLGSAVFCNGGLRRYPFADKNDLVLGPYFTVPEYRGKGIASLFLKKIIRAHEKTNENIYAHVWYENIASIKVLEKLGFDEIGRYSTTKFSKLVKNNEGKLLLFKRKRKN